MWFTWEGKKQALMMLYFKTVYLGNPVLGKPGLPAACPEPSLSYGMIAAAIFEASRNIFADIDMLDIA
jgi:hypothetical protein